MMSLASEQQVEHDWCLELPNEPIHNHDSTSKWVEKLEYALERIQVLRQSCLKNN